MKQNKTLVALVAAGFALSIYGSLARADGPKPAYDEGGVPEQAPTVVAQQVEAPPPPPPVQPVPVNSYGMLPPFTVNVPYRGGVGAVGYTRRPDDSMFR